MRVFATILGVFFTLILSAQQIIIDGDFSDWENIDPIFEDELGDGQSNGIDFGKIWMHNDGRYIYMRFQLNKEINIQEDNDLALYVDFDNDLDTGFKVNGIGAELRWFFGDRYGILTQDGNSEFINFSQATLVVSPSVSSIEFELSFSDGFDAGGFSIEAGDNMAFRMEDTGFSGDDVPGSLFGVTYDYKENQPHTPSEFDLSRNDDTDFRIMTYNILADQLFESNRTQAYSRIFNATQPDIIALQEVRDFDEDEALERIGQFINVDGWYAEKVGFDIVLLSHYPINYDQFLAGNGAFYLDVDGREIMVVNCHLPCCDNDTDRQSEVDQIMEFIRDSRDGLTNYELEESTPYLIVGDMNFVGDNRQPYTFHTGDIRNNSFYGDDFNPDWDGSDLADVNGFATGSIWKFTWINFFSSYGPGKLDWIYYTDSNLKLENVFNLYTPGFNQQELLQYNLESGDSFQASDHTPVVADFSFITTASEDIGQLDFMMYPNPVDRQLFIQMEDDIYIDQVKMVDIQGQVVLSMVPADGRLMYLDVENLPSGRYYVIVSADGKKTGKAVVKR